MQHCDRPGSTTGIHMDPLEFTQDPQLASKRIQHFESKGLPPRIDHVDYTNIDPWRSSPWIHQDPPPGSTRIHYLDPLMSKTGVHHLNPRGSTTEIHQFEPQPGYIRIHHVDPPASIMWIQQKLTQGSTMWMHQGPSRGSATGWK